MANGFNRMVWSKIYLFKNVLREKTVSTDYLLTS